MYVLIVGGGKVGSHLAKTLAAEGHQVTIVEVEPGALRASRGPHGGRHASSAATATSRTCSTKPTRAAPTRSSRRPATTRTTSWSALLGKMEYESPLTVARINNPSNAWLFTERFGVDVPVSNTAIMADVLKSVSLGDIVTMLRLKAENMVIDEIVLPSAAAGGRQARSPS